RRRMRSWLYAVQVGLGDERANPFNEVIRTGFGKNAKYDPKYNRGVAAYTQTKDEETEIREIIVRVQHLVEVVETPESTYETFVEDLGARMKELKQITGPLRVEAEPAKGGPAAAAPAGAAAAATIPDSPAEATPAAPPAAAAGKSAVPVAPPPAVATPEVAPPAATKSP
ncbi:MAG: hypothetical protein WEH44_10220, partial [Pirellulaceae bacterium]